MTAKKILIELHYLPCIQFFSKLYAYEEVIIEQHENYLKGSYRNRAHIAGANGLLRLSIPLSKGKNEQQGIQSVQIAYHDNWQQQHWASIQSAYGNAPFFEYYADAFEPIFKEKTSTLFQFNKQLLEEVLSFLEFPAKISWTEHFTKVTDEKECFDFRNGIFPKKHRQKEDIHFEAKSYLQVFSDKNGFIPNLSILDLLFCHGPQSSLILEDCIK